MYKEQNGARPLRAEADSRDSGVGEGCKGKRQGRKTLVTENSRNGKIEASPRRLGGHGEVIGQKATADCAEDGDRILCVRSGLRPARKPSAEWNGFSLFVFPAMNRWA